MTALEALKAGKARDPNGWVYELFKDGVIGENLKLSLLHMLNKIKESTKIPEFVRLANISTIYKGQMHFCCFNIEKHDVETDIPRLLFYIR